MQGVVQGVGFRPYVYGLATQLQLAGFVGNDSAGVFIEVEGTSQTLACFQERLVNETPPLAHIETVNIAVIEPRYETEFTIAHSQAQATANTWISPDWSMCDECLQELFEPTDPRYRYPFINCTNCGPRFTIIQDVPYDRPLTTMAAFPMCPMCQAEYDDPRNRRFHAQPNACPNCGPQLAFHWSRPQTSALAGQPLEMAQRLLADGGIVAVKGLGGFHLACDATNNQAVETLRQRKARPDKPFAVMAHDVATVRQFADLNADEETLLTSRARPIVLLKKKLNNALSSLVAPGNQQIGVMLPYTPLHYLLLNSADQPLSILVMTSGNYASEPIVTDNQDAFARLSPLVDGFLLHNRDIYAPCDDSVMRVHDGHALPIRRSRGYVPFPITLPFDVPPILAVGGELKSTFCLTKNHHAFMSQHIGDMENLETLQAFANSVAHFQTLFRITPELVVADKHPAYLSTKWAIENRADGVPLVQVQHHHAHIAAVMAEHGYADSAPVIGFSFDGTGYGSDGAIWGGELLLTTYNDFERVAHLKYVPLPGGDVAIKRPYRMALAHLWAAKLSWADHLPSVVVCSPNERSIIQQQLSQRLNAPLTSSMGRLFDAVASLLGVCQTVTYEGQAAIELEAMAAPNFRKLSIEPYRFALSETTPTNIDPTPLWQAIMADLENGLTPAVMSAKFHHAVADLIVQLSLRWRYQEGLNTVALSGGVFQNMTLLRQAVTGLRANNFTVLSHRLVPPNDGGLALGQAVVGRHIC